ncbi:hypothetical protein Hamer_G007886 [Homarus americanus]|uniref:Uncharacterized protein n=2 Tax=Homarus americanus TaxID=6706 RepID=A0A8J5MSP1_HOMAM|nr:hypothetical protein Hamer_G007886 [Homarus americanus]
MLLRTIGQALNFTFKVLPTDSWEEVTRLVMERVSFMATVYHIVLPQRRLLYDYTYPYELGSTDFTMATPSLTPKWQSLYDPLAGEVWASVLGVLLLVPLLLFIITRPKHGEEFDKKISSGEAAHIVVGTLLDQSVNKQHIVSSSSRVLVAA